jgi:hypothetical protein
VTEPVAEEPVSCTSATAGAGGADVSMSTVSDLDSLLTLPDASVACAVRSADRSCRRLFVERDQRVREAFVDGKSRPIGGGRGPVP